MELSCPAPKHCEYGRKMASAASEAHETPRLSATFSSHDPFKTARLNQAGRKNKLRHSCGVTATLATKNHKALYSLLRDQEVACSQTPSSCKLWWPGPSPLAQSRWPGPVARSRPGPGGLSRWPGPGPGPGGPVPVARSRWPGPVARSRWPGPGGPVPVARSRSRFKGACPRARAKKDLFWGLHGSTFTATWQARSECMLPVNRRGVLQSKVSKRTVQEILTSTCQWHCPCCSRVNGVIDGVHFPASLVRLTKQPNNWIRHPGILLAQASGQRSHCTRYVPPSL